MCGGKDIELTHDCKCYKGYEANNYPMNDCNKDLSSAEKVLRGQQK